MSSRGEARKTRLLFMIAGLHHGGAEKVVASLSRHLDSSCFEIVVCWRIARGKIGDGLRDSGYEVVGLSEIRPAGSPYTRFLTLRDLLREKEIDIIHTHDTGSLADAAQSRMFGSSAKIVHTFHFGNYPDIRWTYRAMEFVFSRLAHKLVAVGHEQSKRIQRTLFLAERRLQTIYNGVEELTHSAADDELLQLDGSTAHSVVIGSISTLTEQKGLFVLLDAASILKSRGVDFVLVIAGGGPLQGALEAKVQELDLGQHIRFLGWVDDAANRLLPSLDIFCQSSLWEANSIVLLEAMCAGLPIVTTEVGESQHVIEEGVSGMVVQPSSPQALADGLHNLVENADLRESMGRAARERFENNYTVDKMAQAYHRAYDELL